MKTIAKTLVAVCILMLSLQVNAANSNGNPSAQNQIAYSVKINAPQWHIGGFNLVLYVAVTDEHGKPIAPAQRAVPGKSTYMFYENGPYKGTRVAVLVNDPIVPTNIHFFCAPDVMTGGFQNGVTYDFNLYPGITPIK